MLPSRQGLRRTKAIPGKDRCASLSSRITPQRRPALSARRSAEAGAEIALRQAHLGEPIPDEPWRPMTASSSSAARRAPSTTPTTPTCRGSPALTRQFGEADKPVLGICLGAQLVARGHGAKNILGRPIEFGWQEVRPTEAGEGRSADRRARRRSARSFTGTPTPSPCRPAPCISPRASMTEYQAFRIGRAVYGIQFHFEADRQLVETWSSDFARGDRRARPRLAGPPPAERRHAIGARRCRRRGASPAPGSGSLDRRQATAPG